MKNYAVCGRTRKWHCGRARSDPSCMYGGMRTRRSSVIAWTACVLFGCSSSGGPPGSTSGAPAGGTGAATSGAGAGTGGSGISSAGAIATAGTSSGDSVGAGTGSVVATSGASGGVSSGAGSGAGSGAVSTLDGGAEGSVPVSGKGTQADPGTTGDGTVPLPGPYTTPPEAAGPINAAPKGTLTPPALYASKAVYPGIKFQYTIYVPAQYQKGKPAALMIYLDGRHYVTIPPLMPMDPPWPDSNTPWNAHVVMDNLIHAGDIPVTIAVFIDPGTPSGIYHPCTGCFGPDQQMRSTQYDQPTDNYSKFTLNEFLPDVVFPKYDIVQDPDGWAGVGHSSGGIAVFMMAWFHPDKFHKVLTESASFSNTGMMPPSYVFPAKIASTTPPLPLRVYLLSSSNDLGGGVWRAANDQAAMDLMAKGYHYRYRTGTSPHFPTPAAVQDFPDAMRWLWRGYKLPWYP